MKRQGYFVGAVLALGCVAGAMRGGAQETPPAATPPAAAPPAATPPAAGDPARIVLKQAIERFVRTLLRAASADTQPANVDTVVALVEQRRSTYEAVREAEKNVAQAVRAGIAPAQLRVLLNQWSDVAQDERERRVAALQNFAVAADVPGNPRLESWLRLTGIMGEEEAFMDTPRQAVKRQARTPQGLMTSLGFDDATLQSAVIEHLRREQEAMQPLQQRSIALDDVMIGRSATNAQVAEALSAWKAAVQQDKARRAAALQALDARIGFSQNVRLAALLRLMGIVGDEAAVLNGGQMGFNAVGITDDSSNRKFVEQLTKKPGTA